MRRTPFLVALLAGTACASLHAGHLITTAADAELGTTQALADYNSIANGVTFQGGGANTTFGSTALDHTGDAAANVVFATVRSPVGSTAAVANANAVLGTVGIAATGIYGTSTNAGDGFATAIAEVTDQLHFKFPGATATTVSDVRVSYDIRGSMTVDNTGSFSAIVTPQIRIGSTIFNETWSAEPSNNYTPAITASEFTGWKSYSFSRNTLEDTAFTGVLEVTGPTADLSVEEFIFGATHLGATIDYSHTASLSLAYAPGVTFTSDSGTFLTAAVPEPASIGLMSSLALACKRRRK